MTIKEAQEAVDKWIKEYGVVDTDFSILHFVADELHIQANGNEGFTNIFCPWIV